MIYSQHATNRMKQRSIKQSTIDYVLYFGTTIYKAGAVFCYLRDRDLPEGDRNNPELAKLAGTAVVLDPEDYSVLTVWKNKKKGLSLIKRKPKYNIKPKKRFSDGKGLGWQL